MKLKSYLLAGMAAIALSSCNEDFGDWVTPAGNEQAAIYSFGNGTVKGVGLIDLASLGSEQTSLKVADIVAPKADSIFATTYQIQLGDKLYDISPEGVMSKEALENYVVETFGRRPVERDMKPFIIATVSNGTTATRYTLPFDLQVKLKAPFIDSAYYLVGDMAGWDAAKAIKFNHSGADVYEDSKFTITFTTTKADQYWKIIPQTNYAGDFWANGTTGVLGTAVDGDPALSGTLVTEKPQGGKIEKPGIYRMTIDMMNYTYTLEELNFTEFIYETGGNTSWNDGLAMWGPNFDGKYYGAFYLDGEFKFKPYSDKWDGDWEWDGDGKLNVSGKSNIPAPAAGFYFVTVDVASLTYSLKPFVEMRVVGDAVGDWTEGKSMTWNAANHTWELKGVTLAAGSIKFRDQDTSWSGVNLGGQLSQLSQNGGNIAVAAGTYDIVLHTENANRAPYAELIAK